MRRKEYIGKVTRDYTEHTTMRHVDALTGAALPHLDLPLTFERKAGARYTFRTARELAAWIAERPDCHAPDVA